MGEGGRRPDDGQVSCSCPLAEPRQTLRPHQSAGGAADSFSLRAKSRLRRLRSDTRLRAQPLGGSHSTHKLCEREPHLIPSKHQRVFRFRGVVRLCAGEAESRVEDAEPVAAPGSAQLNAQGSVLPAGQGKAAVIPGSKSKPFQPQAGRLGTVGAVQGIVRGALQRGQSGLQRRRGLLRLVGSILTRLSAKVRRKDTESKSAPPIVCGADRFCLRTESQYFPI